MKCKICGSEVNLLFKSLVLNKHRVGYYKCPNCEFIQTESPHWLNEAYMNAITDLDVGLVSRNLNFTEMVGKIIKKNFDYKNKFLDYAGGYGLFVRLMRDRGFNFYREDKYCENIFAQNYDLEDIENGEGFEVVTAFEVFEHLENPLEEIEKMFKYSDTVIFSTDLQPNQEIRSIDDWWYFTPETGQHIAFYSTKTLQFISKELDLNYFSNGLVHMLSKRIFRDNPLIIDEKYVDTVKMESLIGADFNFSKNILKEFPKTRKEIKKYKQEDAQDILIKKISSANANLIRIAEELKDAKIELDNTKIELDKTKIELDNTKIELDKTKIELDNVKIELYNTKIELDDVKIKLNLFNLELMKVYNSREWRLILKLQKFFKAIFPVGSFRRKILVELFRFLKKIVKIFFKVRIKILEISLLSKKYLVMFGPRKKRKINLKSRKLVYIGHSYHNKTKSTLFLIDYLKEFFDVKVVLDESWQGGPAPDLSFIDKSYLGVVFFQLLPSSEVIKNIKNDNIIYFPMYDQSGLLDFKFWGNYLGLKIVNFSSTLHQKLKKWGFESIYIQYFPNKSDFIPGKKNEVFFWQRLTKVAISKIIGLLDKENVKIHIHKAVDPNQEFIQPNIEDEKRFQITYSDWFDTREEMWDVIKQKGIYVAPREYEGIGMSFLEAMAMGKAVIAVNNPTMNEYIEHGKTGYLYDLNNPKEVDLSNMEEVQKNTYQYMQEGYIKWNQNKEKIIDFIRQV